MGGDEKIWAKKHGHGYGHRDMTRRDTGTRQISKNQDTDTGRTRHNKIKLFLQILSLKNNLDK